MSSPAKEPLDHGQFFYSATDGKVKNGHELISMARLDQSRQSSFDFFHLYSCNIVVRYLKRMLRTLLVLSR